MKREHFVNNIAHEIDNYQHTSDTFVLLSF